MHDILDAKIEYPDIFSSQKLLDKTADVDTAEWENRAIIIFVYLPNILRCFQHINHEHA